MTLTVAEFIKHLVSTPLGRAIRAALNGRNLNDVDNIMVAPEVVPDDMRCTPACNYGHYKTTGKVFFVVTFKDLAQSLGEYTYARN